MTDSVKLIGAERVIATVQGLARDAVTSDMLRSIGLLAVRSVQRGIRDQKEPDGSPYPAVNRFGQGGLRMVDSARILNSITFQVTGHSVMVGTNVDYAPMQHFGTAGLPGGVLKAKNAKLLAIPLTRQIARAYVAGKSLRDQYPDAFLFRSNSQGLFLVRKFPNAKRGSKRQLQFLYQLVSEVTIKGTHFLGVSAEGESDIGAFMFTAYLKRLNAGDNA